jgi:hypothetical protein
MDIELLREAFKNGDKELYFKIREHFPSELIQAEIEHNLKYYQRTYHQFESEYLQLSIKETEILNQTLANNTTINENELIPPSKPPSKEIIIKEFGEYKIDEFVWAWCSNSNNNSGWIKGFIIGIKDDGIWVKLSNDNFGFATFPQQLQPLT